MSTIVDIPNWRSVATLGEASAIATTAYALIDAGEQAGDLAQLVVDTAKMH